MITFHKLGELGRLGNQLFQYAALKGLASKNLYTAKIPNPQTLQWSAAVSVPWRLDLFTFHPDVESASSSTVDIVVCTKRYLCTGGKITSCTLIRLQTQLVAKYKATNYMLKYQGPQAHPMSLFLSCLVYFRYWSGWEVCPK